jgi:uncharacterized membrane protein
MIGCLIFGSLAAMGLARAFHHRRMMCGGWGGCGAWHRRMHGWHGRPGWYGGGDPGGGWSSFDHDEAGGFREPFADDGFGGFEGRFDGGFGGMHAGKRFFLRRLLAHVRATPAQERVITGAFEEFRDELKKVAGGEGRRSRKEIIDALRRESFDGVVLGEQFARHDTVLEASRKAFVGLIAKVHDALDPEQRGRLADLLERGPRLGWWGRGWSGGAGW